LTDLQSGNNISTFSGNNICLLPKKVASLQSNLIVRMNISAEILKFATNKQEFSRKELLENMQGLAEKQINNQLYRLLAKNRLERIKYGVFRIPKSIFTPTDEIIKLNNLIKLQFTYANFCIWCSDVVMPFMRHIPNLNFIFVDVENDVAESVFNFLNNQTAVTVYFRPSKEDIERYLTGTKAIIVRNLVSESPLQTIGNIQTSTFEKVLVDICGDIEFDFMQGAEIHYFYRNVLERQIINKRKLLRYASRRGRRKEVEQLYADNL
jgi:predicted transcriptional regulator of viral defense system